jgi:protein-S-isoprenylcysteine O-methyltransferase Ste14
VEQLTLALVLGFVALRYFEAKARAEERWLAARYPGYESYMRTCGGGC